MCKFAALLRSANCFTRFNFRTGKYLPECCSNSVLPWLQNNYRNTIPAPKCLREWRCGAFLHNYTTDYQCPRRSLYVIGEIRKWSVFPKSCKLAIIENVSLRWNKLVFKSIFQRYADITRCWIPYRRLTNNTLYISC